MIALLLAEQIGVLFLMMAGGFVLVKTGLVKSEESRTLSMVSIYLILPCVTIHAFQVEYSDEIRNGFLLGIFAAVAIHLILFLLSWIFGRLLHLEAVEKASLIYSNAGNLILPLVTAVLGPEWEIYATSFLCVQMILIWTHGQSLMRGQAGINWKKILLNLNLIAIAVGLILFFARIRLPELLGDAVGSMASTIGPVSMVMIGMLLGSVKWKSVFSGQRIYLIVALKMLVFPTAALVFLKLLASVAPVADAQTVLLISLLAVITPSASAITQMAQLYNRNAAYASAINVFTTVVCIVTMPLMVLLYTL